ncbi:MAG: amidohydrolase [Dehalococcoidia bacterium]|nr:amidohydrolase [Dehalococcoidia bacterium]
MDILICNANIITMDHQTPRARALKISEGRVLWVDQMPHPHSNADIVIDCHGQTVLPGFHDAHIHLLAYAGSLTGVDCSPDAVSDIHGIQQAIGRRAQETPRGSWIKAWAYNDFYLRDKRHPNRHDLDAAAVYHPVRLVHRSGHASVLNSLGMALLGITTETAEPPGGMIQRDLNTGEPTGLLFEMDRWLNERIPRPGYDEIASSVQRATQLLSSRGITHIQDASPSNGPEQWALFQSLQNDGMIPQHVTMMAGSDGMRGMLETGRSPYGGSPRLRLGPLKVVLDRTTGRSYPPKEELVREIRWANEHGIQMAVHAVELETVELAVEAFETAQNSRSLPGLRHRIEHASLCIPDLARRMARLGLMVGTQPSFLYHSGDRYLAQVEHVTHLYPLRTLEEAGVVCAFGSDAPVVTPDPLNGLFSAVTRRTSGQNVVNPLESISIRSALEMYTRSAAFSAHLERDSGSITSGKRADLVVLDRDPKTISPFELMSTKVVMTIIDGKIEYEAV